MASRKDSLKSKGIPTDKDAEIWKLRQQGKTLESIARTMKMKFRVVAERVRDMSEEMYNWQLEQIKSQQAIQLAQLDFIIEAAMEAWEKSCKDEKELERYYKFKRNKCADDNGELTPGDEGKYVPSGKRVLKRKSNGDSTYLNIVLKAQSDKRKLLGIETGSPDIAPSDIEQITRFLIPDNGR